MDKMTPQTRLVLDDLRRRSKPSWPWIPLDILNCYDGRSVMALLRRNLIELDYAYGARVIDTAAEHRMKGNGHADRRA